MLLDFEECWSTLIHSDVSLLNSASPQCFLQASSTRFSRRQSNFFPSPLIPRCVSGHFLWQYHPSSDLHSLSWHSGYLSSTHLPFNNLLSFVSSQGLHGQPAASGSLSWTFPFEHGVHASISSHFTAAGGATGMEVSTGTEEVSTASATFAVGVEVPYVPASSKSLV